jgi:hypothetical protein
MKKTVCLIILLSCAIPAYSQGYDPSVAGWINKVDIDTLTSFVRILSGEDSVEVGGAKVLIKRRVGAPGNDLAADYVKQTLSGYGLAAYDQLYSGTGRNVYAIQIGSLYPEKQFIVCAHYDGVTDYCADDNASGVAAVLEAARILSAETLNYTVIYAVWDEEELGLVGSSQYAAQAALDGDDIRGVLNLDMLSWDSNGDGMCDIHSGSVGSSNTLANLMVSVDSVYALPLAPVIRNPGTGASDHASFWNRGYSAVLLIEAYYGGDFTPYYHSTQDRLDKFNLPYFHDMTKLAVGTLSTLASGRATLAVTVDASEKWNILSLPVSVANDSVASVFPAAVSDAFGYSGGPGYQARKTMETGRGYWVRFESPGSVGISGAPFAAETVSVASGWNLIGSSPATIHPSAIASIPPGLMTSQFFGYDGGYGTVDSIVPGKGYWVKVEGTGQLVLPGASGSWPANRINIVATAELPPPPPGQFAGGTPSGAPSEYALGQNYPNPFNPTTMIEYTLPEGTSVRVSLCNVLGEELRTLVDEYQPAGTRTVSVDASDLPSGVYICRMQAGGFSATRKMVFIR